MKFIARCFVLTFAALMVLGQIVSFGMKEGWGMVLIALVTIALLALSFWYGFLHDDD